MYDHSRSALVRLGPLLLILGLGEELLVNWPKIGHGWLRLKSSYLGSQFWPMCQMESFIRAEPCSRYPSAEANLPSNNFWNNPQSWPFAKWRTSFKPWHMFFNMLKPMKPMKLGFETCFSTFWNPWNLEFRASNIFQLQQGQFTTTQHLPPGDRLESWNLDATELQRSFSHGDMGIGCH